METAEVSYQHPAPHRNGGHGRGWGRIAGALLVSGAVVGGVAITHGQSSSAATGKATTTSTSSGVTTQTTASTTQGTSTGQNTQNWQGGTGTLARHGGRGFGGGAGFGGFGGPGGGLTVTAVDPSAGTITATGPFSGSVTIAVSSSTTYSEAGNTVNISAVQTGEHIAVRGTRNSQNTLAATSITIILPRTSGEVTAVSGQTITVTGPDGTAQTITVTADTHYSKAGQTASLTDITTGTAITAEGTSNSDGSLTAISITIQIPSVRGQVTAIGTGTYTISDHRGNTTVTVNTTGSTVYVNADGSTAQASAITTSTFISAEGTLSSDGKTLTASKITIMPAGGAGRGFGPGKGGPGNWSQGNGLPGVTSPATTQGATGSSQTTSTPLGV